MGSSSEPNLICRRCKQAFYSEAADRMNGRPCSVEGCDGTLLAGPISGLESTG